jgi:hypothetical protein
VVPIIKVIMNHLTGFDFEARRICGAKNGCNLSTSAGDVGRILCSILPSFGEEGQHGRGVTIEMMVEINRILQPREARG